MTTTTARSGDIVRKQFSIWILALFLAALLIGSGVGIWQFSNGASELALFVFAFATLVLSCGSAVLSAHVTKAGSDRDKWNWIGIVLSLLSVSSAIATMIGAYNVLVAV